MADKKTHRREKRLTKRRLKARDKSRTTRARRRGGASAASAARAAGWPTGEAYVSEDWHEQGPTVHAVLTRARADGRMAAALFEVDLRERGVLDAQLELDWRVPNLQRALVERSGEKPMVTCEPELVVRLVDEGRRHGAEGDHSQAPGLERARALFGDLEPSDHEILVGDMPPERPDKPGVLSSIVKRFTGR